ncbi:MAG: hypothetical protein QOF69_1847, partial [Solirubrobacteraceae bacterium]|nr:hypothetical protein [Solirubrobacteraceae bacterium]
GAFASTDRPLSEGHRPADSRPIHAGWTPDAEPSTIFGGSKLRSVRHRAGGRPADDRRTDRRRRRRGGVLDGATVTSGRPSDGARTIATGAGASPDTIAICDDRDAAPQPGTALLAVSWKRSPRCGPNPGGRLAPRRPAGRQDLLSGRDVDRSSRPEQVAGAPVLRYAGRSDLPRVRHRDYHEGPRSDSRHSRVRRPDVGRRQASTGRRRDPAAPGRASDPRPRQMPTQPPRLTGFRSGVTASDG